MLGDPIAAVAAETREQARAAAAAVKVTYEPLKVMMTPQEALAADAVQIHPPFAQTLCCRTSPRSKGDGEKGLSKSELVVEAEIQYPDEPSGAAGTGSVCGLS